ncbi:MAG: ATP-binding cassette domain-containing protein [Rikenellaceae bacterium]|nr:ATP-binding cassette domain-containing protein [Rikenellaceae bacterium]
MNILTVTHVTKHYGSIRALQEVSFGVPERCVFGILEPNGSGKTTLLGIAMGITRASSGSCRLFEDEKTPPAELRKRVGTLLETPNFYHYLSAVDNLKITAGIKKVPFDQIDSALRKTGFYERRNSKFSTFSLGMKQRLGIAGALLGNPQVLVLDEPTNGLDPEGIAEICSLIRELGAAGHTIIMASHLLDEVEKVCSHVAILKSGKLLAAGKSDEILAEGDRLEIASRDNDRLYRVLKDQLPQGANNPGRDVYFHESAEQPNRHGNLQCLVFLAGYRIDPTGTEKEKPGKHFLRIDR